MAPGPCKGLSPPVEVALDEDEDEDEDELEAEGAYTIPPCIPGVMVPEEVIVAG
jgi:hypothetical protein